MLAQEINGDVPSLPPLLPSPVETSAEPGIGLMEDQEGWGCEELGESTVYYCSRHHLLVQ